MDKLAAQLILQNYLDAQGGYALKHNWQDSFVVRLANGKTSKWNIGSGPLCSMMESNIS